MSPTPATTDDILKSLEGFPQDVSELIIPDGVNAEELIASLDSLAHSTPTPEARNCIAQVATKLPPSVVLQNTLREWSQDPGLSTAAVTQLIASGIANGTFDKDLWLRNAASGDYRRARAVVEAWGLENLEDLLTAYRDMFSDPELRVGILTAIQSIILRSPYSPEDPPTGTPMYRLATDDMFGLMIKCLLLDTSNRLFAIALSTVVVVLPFALQSMNDHVPLLMAILGRAICWRDRPFVDAESSALSGVTRTPAPNPSISWAVATSASSSTTSPSETDPSFQSVLIEKRVVDLYLIGLYGAWPSNVIGFTRNPPEYLQTKQIESVYAVPWDEVWEPGVLASRLIPLIADFQLHPSIITFTSSGELQDEKRWDKYDPSEFVAMCHLMSNNKDEGMFEFFKLPATRLDPRPLEMERVPTETTGLTDDIGRLREENELLRLESLYSDRQRMQLFHHISRLHRNSLRFNIDENEMHMFVNRIKEQAKTISTLTAELSQQRSEASQAQQKHVKWQKELRDKVSGFREERRNWQTEATSLRAELQEAQALASKQREELAGVKNERFVLQSQMLEATPMIRHLDDYKARIKQLTDSQLLWDSDIAKLREAESAVEDLLGRAHELEGMVRARDKLCREQADTIQELESRTAKLKSMSAAVSPAPASPAVRPTRAPEPVDSTYYVTVAENARRRAEKLERENLELVVELERLRRASIANAAGEGSNSLLYGEVG